jgi:hypothetical protein
VPESRRHVKRRASSLKEALLLINTGIVAAGWIYKI